MWFYKHVHVYFSFGWLKKKKNFESLWKIHQPLEKFKTEEYLLKLSQNYKMDKDQTQKAAGQA